MTIQNTIQRPMWKSFAQSLGLLTISLLAALNGAGAANAGRVLEAGASELLALGIAMWVAWKLVPRLARGVDWDWMRFGAQFQVTRDGWIYLGAVAIVAVAAVNTSNNLLYMVLSALVTILLLSGILSGLNLLFVSFDLRLPAVCHAGAAFPFSILIRNGKRFFPTFSLQASAAKDDLHSDSLYFTLVRPRGSSAQSGTAVCSRRGRHTIDEIGIRSRYPFGFLFRGRRFKVSAVCIAFPAIVPAEQMNLSISDIQGSGPHRSERGLGQDLHMIRDYVPSDSARNVHWKATAKTGSLKTREFAQDESRRVVLAFDRCGNDGDAALFEELVSRAASLTFHLIGQGVEVAFVSDNWHTPHGSSDEQLEAILTWLALVEMSSEARKPGVDPGPGVLTLSLEGAARRS